MSVTFCNQTMGSLDSFKDAFSSVGWFIPPYVSIGFLGRMVEKIDDARGSYAQGDLEMMLSLIYAPESLAAMVLHRYAITPCVKEYAEIISESVLAHFSGLDHVAVVGLLPVIEGAGTALAKGRGIAVEGRASRKIFIDLAEHCREFSKERGIGDAEAIASMMDSFKEYADKHLYVESSKYPHPDKTNRHGILHGAYTDGDYGAPINFYKAIAAVDFLCFISAFQSAISWFAPDPTPESGKLAEYYSSCVLHSAANPANKGAKLDPRSIRALIGLKIRGEKPVI